MSEGNLESGKRAERKERDSSPQESDAMKRYIDLRADSYDALMSNDERKEYAQKLIDLVRLLNEGVGIEPEVREELLGQVRILERDYLLIKQVAETVKQLERESRGDVQVPHVYRKAIGLINSAIKSGVPSHALEPLQRPVIEYLRRVRLQSR